ncbi:MAG: hypothetical protein HZB51_08560 [Chloroflexi bacterium]|nr:hypothetical protein [Chloroflexota bacterium]
MAGWAVLSEKNTARVLESEFDGFLRRVANAKRLDLPTRTVHGCGCVGAKLDSSVSLHRGVTVDAATGSWLIAAGTVVDTLDPALDGNLSKLLRDFGEHGSSVLQRLDGVFGLAIYDGIRRALSIVVDPFGFFSVFYGERGDRRFIGTSALAVAQQIQATPSELGVECFLRTGKVFGELTLWQEVKRLRPATVLELSERGIKESTYWQPAIDRSLSQLSLADSVDAAAEVLPGLLKRNLAREGKVWSDLTGGFDTRFLVLLLERAGLPFKANFVGPENHPDVQVARKIIQQTNWEYQHFQLPDTWTHESANYLNEAVYRGDGHLNIFLLLRPLWVHHREREQFPMLLSGLGGEMWRGLNWWSERAGIGRTNMAHYERQLWSLMHPIPDGILTSDARSVQNELIRQFQNVGERLPDAANNLKLDWVYTYRETAHAGAFSSCAAGLLRIVPPMFSKEIVSFVMSLDYRWRVNNSIVKHMLSKHRPVLANIEIEGRGPAAPLRIDNWYRFVPSWVALSKKTADKFSQVVLGKSIWQRERPEGFSRFEWRQEILRHAATQNLLGLRWMRSQRFYQPEAFCPFLTQAKTERFKDDEFLGRILTVEMALRESEAVAKSN